MVDDLGRKTHPAAATEHYLLESELGRRYPNAAVITLAPMKRPARYMVEKLENVSKWRVGEAMDRIFELFPKQPNSRIILVGNSIGAALILQELAMAVKNPYSATRMDNVDHIFLSNAALRLSTGVSLYARIMKPLVHLFLRTTRMEMLSPLLKGKRNRQFLDEVREGIRQAPMPVIFYSTIKGTNPDRGDGIVNPSLARGITPGISIVQFETSHSYAPMDVKFFGILDVLVECSRKNIKFTDLAVKLSSLEKRLLENCTPDNPLLVHPSDQMNFSDLNIEIGVRTGAPPGMSNLSKAAIGLSLFAVAGVIAWRWRRVPKPVDLAYKSGLPVSPPADGTPTALALIAMSAAGVLHQMWTGNVGTQAALWPSLSWSLTIGGIISLVLLGYIRAHRLNILVVWNRMLDRVGFERPVLIPEDPTRDWKTVKYEKNNDGGWIFHIDRPHSSDIYWAHIFPDWAALFGFKNANLIVENEQIPNADAINAKIDGMPEHLKPAVRFYDTPGMVRIENYLRKFAFNGKLPLGMRGEYFMHDRTDAHFLTWTLMPHPVVGLMRRLMRLQFDLKDHYKYDPSSKWSDFDDALDASVGMLEYTSFELERTNADFRRKKVRDILLNRSKEIREVIEQTRKHLHDFYNLPSEIYEELIAIEDESYKLQEKRSGWSLEVMSKVLQEQSREGERTAPVLITLSAAGREYSRADITKRSNGLTYLISSERQRILTYTDDFIAISNKAIKSNKWPKVSIGIPIVAGSPHIDRMLTTIRNQLQSLDEKGCNVEIFILVNGDNPDENIRTKELILERTHGLPISVNVTQRVGELEAKRILVETAHERRAEIIALIDDDIRMEKGAISSMVHMLLAETISGHDFPPLIGAKQVYEHPKPYSGGWHDAVRYFVDEFSRTAWRDSRTEPVTFSPQNHVTGAGVVLWLDSYPSRLVDAVISLDHADGAEVSTYTDVFLNPFFGPSNVLIDNDAIGFHPIMSGLTDFKRWMKIQAGLQRTFNLYGKLEGEKSRRIFARHPLMSGIAKGTFIQRVAFFTLVLRRLVYFSAAWLHARGIISYGNPVTIDTSPVGTRTFLILIAGPAAGLAHQLWTGHFGTQAAFIPGSGMLHLLGISVLAGAMISTVGMKHIAAKVRDVNAQTLHRIKFRSRVFKTLVFGTGGVSLEKNLALDARALGIIIDELKKIEFTGYFNATIVDDWEGHWKAIFEHHHAKEAYGYAQFYLAHVKSAIDAFRYVHNDYPGELILRTPAEVARAALAILSDIKFQPPEKRVVLKSFVFRSLFILLAIIGVAALIGFVLPETLSAWVNSDVDSFKTMFAAAPVVGLGITSTPSTAEEIDNILGKTLNLGVGGEKSTLVERPLYVVKVPSGLSDRLPVLRAISRLRKIENAEVIEISNSSELSSKLFSIAGKKDSYSSLNFFITNDEFSDLVKAWGEVPAFMGSFDIRLWNDLLYSFEPSKKISDAIASYQSEEAQFDASQ